MCREFNVVEGEVGGNGGRVWVVCSSERPINDLSKVS